MTPATAAIAVAIMAAITIASRFTPFLIFCGGDGKETPAWVVYLGKVFPYAIMAMLVVYCLRTVTFTAPADWVPALVASLAIVTLYAWRRNTLLAILGGTALYMLLIQAVF